jgi:hypothetical protein
MASLDAVPACLRSLKQWVCWKFVQRESEKPTKIPVTIGGYGADATDPMDWYDFPTVCEHARKFAGIGFVFSPNDPYVGVDIDDCFATPGELKPWAVPIVERLEGTYGEVSPSGNGLKFFCIGTNPFVTGKRVKCGDGAIEIYSQGRFFAVTGQAWDDAAPYPKQDVIDWLLDTYWPKREVKPAPIGFVAVEDSERIRRAEKYLETMGPSVSGSGGHNACYRAACKMVIGFDLDTESAFNLLATVYNPRCQPPWSEKELRHKVDQANKETCERGGMLTDSRGLRPIDHYPGVDLSMILSRAPKPIHGDSETPDDETFFGEMVPKEGLIRQIFEYYKATAFQSTNTMGLAIAVSILETCFGRRVTSHTDLRTNDYNIIVAGTSTGKEACEATSQKVIDAAIKSAGMQQGFRLLIPPDVQSGNALAREVSEVKCGLWICDEFGKHLRVILDKKSTNSHAAAIGTYLLKIYNKANQTYYGASHSAGNRSQVEQPHLCLLGMTTGSVFEIIGADQIEDGLFSRLVWWPVQDRPRRSKEAYPQPVPFELAAQLGLWVKFQPGFEGLFPDPVMIDMEQEAKRRWERHSDLIRERMDKEGEMRAAIWARVAARAMKFAMVHRCARFNGDPKTIVDEPIQIEVFDVEWGIKIANWLAKIACDLVRENVADLKHVKVMNLIFQSIQDGEKDKTWLLRKYRNLTAGDITAAATELQKRGKIEVREETTKGRPKTLFSLAKDA